MLTQHSVRTASAALRPRKLFDRDGLYLLVSPAGSRCWRFKYRFGGKEKLMSLGMYPDVSLKEARTRRDDARRTLSRGVDPCAARKAARATQIDTFEEVT